MVTLLVPILIALAVASAAWGITAAIAGRGDHDKRRLYRRLSDGASGDDGEGKGQSKSVRIDVSYIPPALRQLVVLHRLRTHVEQAYPDLKLSRFLIYVALLAFGFGSLTFAVSTSLLAAYVAGFLGGYLPIIILGQKRARRQRLIGEQLPDALDFLSRVLRAGHSLTIGLQMMGDELSSPIADEFRLCYDQHSLGQPLEDCLRSMTGRIDSSEFAFFVTAILIQRSTGGDLSEVLENISGMIRSRARLQSHVRAKTAEGRFTGYILVAFPAVMFVLTFYLNPDYAGSLVNTDTGRMLLGVSFGLQMAGLYAIRKITTVRA